MSTLTTNPATTPRSAVAASERESEVFDTQEWCLVQRIAASPGFRKSALLTSFLLYITEQKLRGRLEEISEFQIGVRALRRPATYNPGDDNIVRNYARRLRQRLDEYFAQNPNERLRVSVPLGSYVPEFEEVKVAIQQPVEQMDKKLTVAHFDRTPIIGSHWLMPGVLVAVLIGVGLGTLVHMWNRSRPEALFHQFWSQVFDSKRTTYVVTTDTGIAMLQDISGHYIHLQEYVNNSLPEKLSGLDILPDPKRGRFGVDRFTGFTSTANFDVALRLAATSEYKSGHAVMRSARDIRMDDLNYANAIFLGGPHANPWVELFDSTADFRIDFPQSSDTRRIGEKWIVDAHPQAGAKTIYSNESRGYLHGTYAILAFLPSLDKRGYVLLSEGQNMPGTAAAAEFAMNSTAMAPILKKARLPDGTIGPFQLLLETAVVGAKAPEAHVVIDRYGLRK